MRALSPPKGGAWSLLPLLSLTFLFSIAVKAGVRFVELPRGVPSAAVMLACSSSSSGKREGYVCVPFVGDGSRL